jgi:hypothetical protein
MVKACPGSAVGQRGPQSPSKYVNWTHCWCHTLFGHLKPYGVSSQGVSASLNSPVFFLWRDSSQPTVLAGLLHTHTWGFLSVWWQQVFWGHSRLAYEVLLGRTITVWYTIRLSLIYYGEIMTNTGHYYGLFITVDGFWKVTYADIPVVKQLSFAFKGRRKQEYQEIGGAGGVAQVVGCLPSKCEAWVQAPVQTAPIEKEYLPLEVVCLHWLIQIT